MKSTEIIIAPPLKTHRLCKMCEQPITILGWENRLRYCSPLCESRAKTAERLAEKENLKKVTELRSKIVVEWPYIQSTEQRGCFPREMLEWLST